MFHPRRSRARRPQRTRRLRDGRRIVAAGLIGLGVAGLILDMPPGIGWGLTVIGLGLLAPSSPPTDQLAAPADEESGGWGADTPPAAPMVVVGRAEDAARLASGYRRFDDGAGCEAEHRRARSLQAAA